MNSFKKSPTSFDDFLRQNRILINANMQKILWFCILSGPAIALGIFTGIFPYAKYFTCVTISAAMFILSIIHSYLFKVWPDSVYTSFFAIIVMDVLLLYMRYSHISINLAWFLLPFISLLFCDVRIYIATLAINYFMMTASCWISASYLNEVRTDYDTPFAYFLNEMGGHTIQYVIMSIVGYEIGKVSIRYFKTLLQDKRTILENEEQLNKQFVLLDSMAEIYDNVNLLDFEKETEQSLRDDKKEEFHLDIFEREHSHMVEYLADRIIPDQRDDFLEFTSLKTIQFRLINKKIIYDEFIDIYTGWLRAQYIVVETNQDGLPKQIIFTTQNIDADKRKEEHLRRIALTDELTRLYNRRSYDEDVAKIDWKELPQDFGILSADVNGLKQANDSLGHAAGDELIRAAADCLVAAIGQKGKVYRTGGDEFMALLNTSDIEEIFTEINDYCTEWSGILIKDLSISLGYAAHKNHTDASIHDLELIADNLMYENKSRYYRSKSMDKSYKNRL